MPGIDLQTPDRFPNSLEALAEPLVFLEPPELFGRASREENRERHSRYLRYFLKDPSETSRPAFASSIPCITLSSAALFSQSQRSSAGISTKGSSTIFPSFWRRAR